MSELGIITKSAYYTVKCPYCDMEIFNDGYITLAAYRKKFDGEKCPECGEIVKLGKVKNW